MESIANDSSAATVFGVVGNVRRRWRLARALRGLAIVAGALVVLLVVAALLLQAVTYAPAAVIAARIVAGVVMVALLAYYVVLPLLPKPSDASVALYVEEHEPTLEGSLVSAVEVSTAHPARQPAGNTIAALVSRMALERTRAIDWGRRVDQRGMRGSIGGLVAAVVVMLLVLTFGGNRLGAGIRALLVPWGSAEAANPFRIAVHPGNATVPRGGSVVVVANPVGFTADGAALLVRTSDTTEWTRIAMNADSGARFSARLLDVVVPTQYMVETSMLRSRVYHLAVADLPYARRLDLEYRFPAYTGLPVQRVDSTGDIAAPAGTVVRVRVHPTVPTPGGRLVIERGDTIPLSLDADGSLVGVIRVARPGFYRVELKGPNGDLLTASLSYSIDVLADRKPSVSFAKPGRDTRALAVDEVYSEARAVDDYGVARLDLVYSVNGGDERTVPLHRGSRIIKDIAAGHTFMLEEFGLQPGDVVSYYARATDNNTVSGPQTATSDIYFVQIRPYSQEYRQAQEGGGGGGGGGGEQPGQLSQRQREIIAGTFNAMRDSAGKPGRELEEDMATLRLAQQRLREDVEQLARRLVERGVAAQDSTLAKIATILPLASAAMDTAEKQLASEKLRSALQPEQRALQQLQRAEAEFRRVQVQMGEQGGGGGGGGQQQAEDLADLFELQRERMRNQYETLQRAETDAQQQQNEQVDATAERLRQLAARQQQENERARRKADSLARVGASGGNAGDAQRSLAQETEQAARQLERLARERESQSLGEAARRMNEAADAMRRSAANSGQRGAEEAARALERLRDARRLMDQDRGNRMQRAMDDAAESGRRLAEQQRRVQDDVARSGAAQPGPREEMQESIERRKVAMADSTRELARRLDRAALETRRENPDAARQIAEAADTLRQRRIEDKLRVTADRLRETPQEYQNLNERLITADIAELNRALEEARVAARSGRSSADSSRRLADAMDRTRELVSGMESLDERQRQGREERAQDGQQSAKGQQPGAQPSRGQQAQGQESGGQQPGGQQPSGQQPSGQQPGGQQPGGQQARGQQSGNEPGGQPGAEARGGQTGGGGAPRGESGQFGRELRERLNDARELRRDLEGRGVDVAELERAIARMQRLGTSPDEQAARDLRAQVIEGLRAFEFQLGRALGDRGERVLVERTGEVPPQYRKYVEEYYRSLGRTKPK
jgi:hypothetical protein